MRLPGSGRAEAWLKRLWRRFDPGAVILAYHRVADLDADPQQLAVSRKHFDEHMAVLRSFPCCRPADLIGGPYREQGKARVAVTFDDGYADNFHNAAPRLAAANIPATVFVATGQIGDRGEWWWDELERLILLPASLPAELALDDGDAASFRFNASELASGSRAPDGGDPSVKRQSDQTLRHKLYRQLLAFLHPLPTEMRDRLLAQLRVWSGQGDVGRASHRAMTEQELRGLAEYEQIELGAHTVDHVRLAGLSYEQQRHQLRESRRRIEEITRRLVRSFAYPYGYLGSYDQTSLAAIADEGFAYACAILPEAVRATSRRYELPRFLVRDWGGDEFERRLRDWARC